MPDRVDKISAIVLSGGRGQRFGFEDKGLLEWRGKPLIEYVLQGLAGQCQQIIINCNRNGRQYQSFGYSVFEDENKDYPGPLEGIRSSAAAVLHPWCLISPNDIPKLPADLVARLLEAAKSNHWQIAYPRCGERRHYLPVLVETNILGSIERQLQTGDHSLHGWFEHFRAGAVDFSNQADAFTNVNTPQVLQSLS